MSESARQTVSTRATPPKRGTRSVWPVICLIAVLLILSAYLLLVVSNVVYLTGIDEASFSSVAQLLKDLRRGIHDILWFFTSGRMSSRFWLTVKTASISTMLSLLVGIPAGYALSRFRFPWPNLTRTLIDLPVMVPPAAVGVFLFGVMHGWPVKPLCEMIGISFAHNTNGVILVQFVVTVSFCARLMKSSFDGVNPHFEQVSRSLGASLPRTFWKLTLPLAKRGIIASTIVVWARAAAEWEALMLFVGGTEAETDVMPFAVYLDWNGGMMGWVASYSIACILLAVASMAAVRIIAGKSYLW